MAEKKTAKSKAVPKKAATKKKAPAKKKGRLKKNGQPVIGRPKVYATTGRKKLYKPEFADQIFTLRATGQTDEQIAVFYKVSRATLSSWKVTYPKFLDNYRAGNDECANGLVKSAVFGRATGMKLKTVRTEAVVINGEVQADTERVITTITEIAPDTPAAKLWLENKAPNEFKPRKAQEDNAKTGELELADALSKLADKLPS